SPLPVGMITPADSPCPGTPRLLLPYGCPPASSKNPKTNMNPALQKCQSSGRRLWLAGPVLCAALLATAGSLRAQTAPAPASEESDTVKLPTFTVSTERDYGYRA